MVFIDDILVYGSTWEEHQEEVDIWLPPTIEWADREDEPHAPGDAGEKGVTRTEQLGQVLVASVLGLQYICAQGHMTYDVILTFNLMSFLLAEMLYYL